MAKNNVYTEEAEGYLFSLVPNYCKETKIVYIDMVNRRKSISVPNSLLKGRLKEKDHGKHFSIVWRYTVAKTISFELTIGDGLTE